MRTAAGLFVVAVLVSTAVAHAAQERKASLEAEREMQALSGSIEQISPAVAGEQRVTMNGAPLYFCKHTEQGSLDDVMARIAKECASGNESTAFGLTNYDDGREKPIKLRQVYAQEAENGARASLCIFEKDGGSSEEMHRVRYTLAAKRDDGSIAVTSIVNASGTPLGELFPMEGDAPGSDLEAIPRPEQAKRTLTAVVGKDGAHAVRIYESTESVENAIVGYDRQMLAAGFATTGTLAEARMYRRDGQSYVASFRGTTAGSTVALLPFGNIASR